MLRALAACSVDSAAALFAMSAWNKVRDTGRQFVSPEELLDWSRLLESAVMHVGPGLWAASGGERSGFDAALAFVVEITMRDEADPSAEALRIAEGTLTLDAALRARELERLSRQVAVEVPPAAPETPGAAVLARLAAANQLVTGDLTVPVPAGAQPQFTAHPSYTANAEGAVIADFLVPGTVDDAHAFYRGWARRDGWLIELVEPGQVGGLRLARGDRRIGLVLMPWLDGIAIHVMLHRTAAATYRLGPDDAPPAVPPVRRPYPLVGERDETTGRVAPRTIAACCTSARASGCAWSIRRPERFGSSSAPVTTPAMGPPSSSGSTSPWAWHWPATRCGSPMPGSAT